MGLFEQTLMDPTRFFKNLVSQTSCLGVIGLLSLQAASAASRPNFVFIYTDDQRWDIMGVVQKDLGAKGRFPWLKTPNMDRIANEGVRFRNAFVVNSLCAPSRATFLTGQYGFANGVVNNHTPFHLNNVTHASLLRAAGYRTAYVGKWHMGQQVERPGFDFSASFLGQGKYFNCPIYVNGQSTPSTGWVDDVTTDYALKFIRENQDRPFLMVIGYKATHGPFTPPPRREKDYEGEQARAVPNLNAQAIYRKESQGQETPETGALRKVNLDYFRCVTAADDNVGRVLDLLDDLKLAEDTVVVFAGDNGYYLGEHRLGDKRTAYEESLRIPLLLRYPRLEVKGRVVDEMVLNIDLAPTFLDLAGLQVPPQMHGRSWRPLLQGKLADWRKAFFYCYYFERGFGSPMTTAVRTDGAKLIKYPGHAEWTELFDLRQDLYELQNLIQVPSAAALRQQMEGEYEKQKTAIGFQVPAYADQPGADAGQEKTGKGAGGKKKKSQ
jgi:arylsulfatase A-like enzyme